MTDVSPKRLAEKLKIEGKKNLEFFRALTPDQWEQQVYSEGASWTVRQVFAHIAEAEKSIPRLITTILEGSPGVPEDFDLDGYNERKVNQLGDISPDELFERFTAHRTATVAMVNKMTPADLEKTGRHPFLGVAPVLEMLKLMVVHINLHQRDIRRALTVE